MSLSDFISIEKIIHPKTEEEIEVIAIRTSPRPQLREHQLTIYIDPKDGTVLNRNYTDSDWCMWVPLPFNRNLHNRMLESSYKATKSTYVPDEDKIKRVDFTELSDEQQEMIIRLARKMK